MYNIDTKYMYMYTYIYSLQFLFKKLGVKTKYFMQFKVV